MDTGAGLASVVASWGRQTIPVSYYEVRKITQVSPGVGHNLSVSPGNIPGGFLDFQFVIPGTDTFATVNEVGLWVENGDAGSVVSFFDLNDALIMSLNTSVGDQFAGIHADEGIGSVRINDVGYFLVDDLQFGSVPEPSSSVLLGFGAAVFAWILRQKLPKRRLRITNSN